MSSGSVSSTIRFIGYAIPTTPAHLVAIGNPNGPGAVAGTYLAKPDVSADIDTRIAVLKAAVETAAAKIQAANAINDATVNNVFVAPEFYFHGVEGPYLYDGVSVADPVDEILAKLRTAFPTAQYPNWTFVFGTAVTAQVRDINAVYASNSATVRNSIVENLSKQWLAAYGPLSGVTFDMLVNFIKNCHSYPNLQVRNRALILSPIGLYAPGSSQSNPAMTTEKYFVSNEDFLLYEVNGKQVVTEQMTGYPPLDLSGGDIKATPFDQYAIFRQCYGTDNFPAYMDFGIEICLDHSDVRLRRNLDREPWPKAGDAIHVHLVPSCGMQINPPSVAADADGFVFNCDGQYGLDTSSGTVGDNLLAQNKVGGMYVNYSYSYHDTVLNQKLTYAAHTQLAHVKAKAVKNDPNAPDAKNATYHAPTAAQMSDVAILTPTAVTDLPKCFAGGAGSVHIYGLTTPYTLYPNN